MTVLDISQPEDRRFLDDLRGLSVLRVVLGHLGLFWLFPPYTGFLHAFLPVLFFVSGVVSFGSYRRSINGGQFLLRRSLTLFTPYYLLLVILFLLSATGVSVKPDLTLNGFVQWLLLNPSGRDTPFPLGQVWFLHALAIITLIAPFAFRGMIRHPSVALLPITLSLLLATWILFERVDRDLWLFGHNLFQPLANAGFFFMGSYIIAAPHVWRRGKLLLCLGLALGVAVALPVALNLPVDFKHHSFAPSLYYVSGSFAVIFALLLLKKQFLWLVDFVPGLAWLLKFVSKHAYPIFLLHSFLIFAAERWFGLISVMGDPPKALLKLLFVLVGTMLLAIPFTACSKAVMKYVQSRIMQPRAVPATTT